MPYAARLQNFFKDSDVRFTLYFNIVFIYIWGYLLWGTTNVGTQEWWLEECGHFLWASFHTGVQISYRRRYHTAEFGIWRWKDERIIWLRVIFLSVFCWEGLELIHDATGFFTTFAQLSNIDTMTDILISGFIGPACAILFWRWKDNLNIFFADPRIKEANEADLRIVLEALHRIAERTSSNEPHVMRSIQDIVRNGWLENHRIRTIIKGIYNTIVRGSRRERRRRKILLNKIKRV